MQRIFFNNKLSRWVLAVLPLAALITFADSPLKLETRPNLPSFSRADGIEAQFNPDSVQACATGCAAVPEATGQLSFSEFARCLQAVSTQDVGVASIELETLLFHAEEVHDYFRRYGCAPLDEKRAAYLREELDLRNALVSLRLTDADGVERISFEQAVPIGVKQHLHADKATNISAPEFSFTVQRVGLYHLWTRI
jgi:hypothetical protein